MFEIPKKPNILHCESKILAFLFYGMPWDTEGTRDVEKGSKVEVEYREGIGTRNIQMCRNMKDDDVIDPFEDMFNAMKAKNVKEGISWSSLDSTHHGQSFNSYMANKYLVLPRNHQIRFMY